MTAITSNPPLSGWDGSTWPADLGVTTEPRVAPSTSKTRWRSAGGKALTAAFAIVGLSAIFAMGDYLESRSGAISSAGAACKAIARTRT